MRHVTMQLEHPSRGLSRVDINPVPCQLIIMPNGMRWLWYPEEVLTQYLDHLWRRELEDPSIGIRKSNIYEWRYKGSLRILSDRLGSNFKWWWSIAEHGYNPPYDPATARMRREGPRKPRSDKGRGREAYSHRLDISSLTFSVHE